MIVVGLLTSFDLDVLTTELNPFDPTGNPSLDDLIYAGVIATVAFAGIEAAANLAPDIESAPDRPAQAGRRGGDAGAADLRRGLGRRADGGARWSRPPDGPQTALGTTYLENPVLGVVENFDPGWVSTVMQVGGGAGRPGGADLGGEHGDARALAPRLRARHQPPDPELARQAQPAATRRRTWRSCAAAVAAIGLIVPADVDLLGGLFAFGATIAFTIAHAVDHPAADHRAGPPRGRSGSRSTSTCSAARVPLPTVVAAVLTALAWVSVIVYHDTRALGRRRAGWSFGLVAYVIYRKGFEGTTLTERVEVPAEALVKDVGGRRVRRHPGARLRDAARRRHRRHRRAARRTPPIGPARPPPRLEVIYVIDLPLTVPLDSPPPPDRAAARERGARAGEGGGGGVRDGRGASVGDPRALDRRPGSSRRRAPAASR